MSEQLAAAPRAIAGLHRALALRDIVPMYVVALFGIQWIATAAQIGPASILLWIVAMVAFFIPSGLTVMELSSHHPDEGGLYVWTRAAFGDTHGFLVGWCYSIGNLPYFPAVLLFASGSVVHIGGWQSLADDPRYHAAFGLALLWIVTGANIAGLERAKWLANIGGYAIAITLVVLFAAAAFAWVRSGSATSFDARSLLPASVDLSSLGLFTTMAFAFAGFELIPFMGGEIDNPRRTLPRAMLVAGVVVAAFYIFGTVSLLIATPSKTLSAITGISEAIELLGSRLGLPLLGPITAFTMTIGTIGGFSAWMMGGARVPFVIGIDRYLPAALGRVHSKTGAPWVALSTVSVVVTALLLASLSSTSINEAYRLLIDLTSILAFLPLLYMFLALPVLRLRNRQHSGALLRVPGGRVGVFLVAGIGATTTILALAMACVPPAEADPWPFALKVIGGTAVLIGSGFLFYARGRRTPQFRAP